MKYKNLDFQVSIADLAHTKDPLKSKVLSCYPGTKMLRLPTACVHLICTLYLALALQSSNSPTRSKFLLKIKSRRSTFGLPDNGRIQGERWFWKVSLLLCACSKCFSAFKARKRRRNSPQLRAKEEATKKLGTWRHHFAKPAGSPRFPTPARMCPGNPSKATSPERRQKEYRPNHTKFSFESQCLKILHKHSLTHWHSMAENPFPPACLRPMFSE